MLKLKVEDRSLCLLQVYATNAVSEYQAFVDDVHDALQRVRSIEFISFWGISTHTLEQIVKHGKALLVDMETQRLTRMSGIYCSFAVATGSAL